MCVCVCAHKSVCGNGTRWDENELYCGRQGWGPCNTDRCGVVASCRGWWEETAVRARGKERGIPIFSTSWKTAGSLQNNTLLPLRFSTHLLLSCLLFPSCCLLFSHFVSYCLIIIIYLISSCLISLCLFTYQFVSSYLNLTSLFIFSSQFI